MKEIDAVPILGKHGKKRERRGAGAAKDAKLLAFQVHWCFDRRILPHEHHVHWREDAVDDNDVFAFAACGGHRCEPTEPDVDLSFCDHEMKIRGAQRFHFVCFQANLIEQAVSFHDETTTVATPLPMKFVMDRASDMKRSIPRINAKPATGIEGTTASVAASVMKPAPVTPDAPLEVSIATPRMVSCCRNVRSMFNA